MLRVKGLDVHYGSVQVLRDVSMEVHDGELVTLIGANGAGKTTFMMALSGVLRPTSGTIEFLGRRIDRLFPDAIIRSGVVQVPQGRLIFADMTTLENLEMGGYVANLDSGRTSRQKIEEVYGYFPILKERRQQKAGTLSGGEQQMLAIARALMAGPKLLLMDEPTSGLAPIVVEELGQMISDLHRQGLSILLVEQNAAMALSLARRGYVLETGQVVLDGNVADLMNNELVRKAYLGL